MGIELIFSLFAVVNCVLCNNIASSDVYQMNNDQVLAVWHSDANWDLSPKEYPNDAWKRSEHKCAPVTYHFCNHESLNYTIYSSSARANDAEFQRNLDDYAMEAQVVYRTIIQTGNTLCLARWRKLICSAWFPDCDQSTGETTPVCQETCKDLMSECPPDKAMNELFREKDTLYGFLLQSVQKFQKAFENCSIFPDSIKDPTCKIYPELVKNTSSRISVKFETGKDVSTEPINQISATCNMSAHNIDTNTQHQYELIRYWVFCWSLICFVSCIFTFSCFLINTHRFKYPEKATVFISLCYIMIALTYITGFFASTTWSCTTSSTGSNISKGLGNFGCVISFAVQYYFLMALSIWWVIFGLSWFLAAGLKWCQETMEKTLWFMFHSVAWTVPALKTIFIVFRKEIDGDPFTGTCFTGYTNPIFLWSLVVAPYAIYLVTGFVLLLMGFISLYLIRKEIRKEPNVSEKAERVIFRVAMFVLIYLMAAAIVLSVFLYEDSLRPKKCKTSGSLNAAGTSSQNKSADYYNPEAIDCFYPSTTALILKYFMLFIPGTLAGFWLWTPKTLRTWQEFFDEYSASSALKLKANNNKSESKSVRAQISPHLQATQLAMLSTGNTTSPDTVFTRSSYSARPQGWDRHGNFGSFVWALKRNTEGYSLKGPKE